MGIPVSLEVAQKAWPLVSYTSSAGLTFPEPQGSSQSNSCWKRGFCFLIRSLVFASGSRKSGDIGKTR